MSCISAHVGATDREAGKNSHDQKTSQNHSFHWNTPFEKEDLELVIGEHKTHSTAQWHRPWVRDEMNPRRKRGNHAQKARECLERHCRTCFFLIIHAFFQAPLITHLKSISSIWPNIFFAAIHPRFDEIFV